MGTLPCPTCGDSSEVTDTRLTHLWQAPAVRRRRACKACGARWTTYESAMAGPDRDRSIGHAQRTITSAVMALVKLHNDLDGAP